MESPARASHSYASLGKSGVSLHRMLVKLPIGAFLGSLVFDALRLVFANPQFSQTAFHLLGLGFCAALLAIGFGIHDWWQLPSGSEQKSIAFGHGWLMVLASVTFGYSYLLRFNEPGAMRWDAVGISLLGLAVLLLAAHRGAHLVTRYGAGTEKQLARNEAEGRGGLSLVKGSSESGRRVSNLQ